MADLTGIAIFTNVARLGGFTAAAKAMGLSKSTVSKQIARLEDRLGARLFNRTTRRLALTEIGAAYFERCRRIVEEAEEAELAVTQMHSEPVGTLRINAPVSFGVLHVAPLLGEFMSRHPAIEVAMYFAAYDAMVPDHEMVLGKDWGLFLRDGSPKLG